MTITVNECMKPHYRTGQTRYSPFSSRLMHRRWSELYFISLRDLLCNGKPMQYCCGRHQRRLPIWTNQMKKRVEFLLRFHYAASHRLL